MSGSKNNVTGVTEAPVALSSSPSSVVTNITLGIASVTQTQATTSSSSSFSASLTESVMVTRVAQTPVAVSISPMYSVSNIPQISSSVTCTGQTHGTALNPSTFSACMIGTTPPATLVTQVPVTVTQTPVAVSSSSISGVKASSVPRSNAGVIGVTQSPASSSLGAGMARSTPAVKVVTQAPVAVTQPPLTVTQAPVAVTQAPVAVTEAPVAVTQAPVAVTQAPVAVTQVPVAVTQAPVAVTQAPVAVTQAPVAVTQAPVAVTQAPVAVTQAPVAVTQAPVVVTQAPVAVSSSSISGVTNISAPQPTVGVSGVTTVATPSSSSSGSNVTNVSPLSMSLTEEESNFLRFTTLILKLVPDALRKMFDMHNNPSGLNKKLTDQTNKDKLKKLKDRNIINASQWAILYPSSGVPVTSTSFDYCS